MSVSSRRLGLLVVAIVVIASLGAIAQTPPSSTSVGPLAGRWATAVTSGGVVDEFRFFDSGKGVEVMMSRRMAGRDVEVGPAKAPDIWDGRRLAIGFVTRALSLEPALSPALVMPASATRSVRVDLDIELDSSRSRWAGTLSREGNSQPIEFRRPLEFASRELRAQLLGSWCPTLKDTSIPCITIANSDDGGVSAKTPRAQVSLDASGRSDPIFMQEEFAGCCNNWFESRLSADGERLEGDFHFGKTPARPGPFTLAKVH